MPPAARLTDMHTCPAHGVGPVLLGEASVLIGFQPAARVSDKLVCPTVPVPDTVLQGEPSVLIGNKPAARLGDPTEHGGLIAQGCPTVLIGSSTQAKALKTDKPFCEECERKKKQRDAQRKRGRT